MNQAKKILYISQEIYPYLPETEMSKIGRYLPQAAQEQGRETRTFMPKFGLINERRNQLHEVIRLSGMNMIIDDTDHPIIIKVASIQSARLQVYFIGNEDYFQRRCIAKDENGVECPDNDERIIFFVRGVLETVKKLRWTPDIIHCQGWMTALAPLYIRKAYADDPFFKKARVVYSVFDDDFKVPFCPSFAEKILVEGVELQHLEGLDEKPADFVELSKLGITYSDGVVQARPEVNEQVMNFARNSGKKLLEFPGDNYAAYIDFYDSLME